jgi:membrane-associated phospholipid phosphatase
LLGWVVGGWLVGWLVGIFAQSLYNHDNKHELSPMQLLLTHFNKKVVCERNNVLDVLQPDVR